MCEVQRNCSDGGTICKICLLNFPTNLLPLLQKYWCGPTCYLPIDFSSCGFRSFRCCIVFSR